jgi:hypothetical protein
MSPAGKNTGSNRIPIQNKRPQQRARIATNQIQKYKKKQIEQQSMNGKESGKPALTLTHGTPRKEKVPTL